MRLPLWTKEIIPPDITFVNTGAETLRFGGVGLNVMIVMYVAVFECFVHLLYYVVLCSIGSKL